jgi:hypothetical protein
MTGCGPAPCRSLRLVCDAFCRVILQVQYDVLKKFGFEVGAVGGAVDNEYSHVSARRSLRPALEQPQAIASLRQRTVIKTILHLRADIGPSGHSQICDSIHLLQCIFDRYRAEFAAPVVKHKDQRYGCLRRH